MTPTAKATSLRTRCLLPLAILITALLASGPAIAERWYFLSSGSFDARRAFNLDSIAPAPGYPTAMTLRVYVHVGIGTFPCGPPSNCLATSQITDYYVDCGRLTAAEMYRVPMDLREKIVAVIVAPYPDWFALYPAVSYFDRDEGRVVTDYERLDPRHHEVRAFCTLYNAGRLNAALRAGAAQR
jgi:hypothetical protein